MCLKSNSEIYQLVLTQTDTPIIVKVTAENKGSKRTRKKLVINKPMTQKNILQKVKIQNTSKKVRKENKKVTIKKKNKRISGESYREDRNPCRHNRHYSSKDCLSKHRLYISAS